MGAGVAEAARQLQALTARRPERVPAEVKPEHARPRSRPADAAGAPAHRAAPWLERSAPFLIAQLLAASLERAAARPSRRAALAAYQAHPASRIHYCGPVTPVDLRL